MNKLSKIPTLRQMLTEVESKTQEPSKVYKEAPEELYFNNYQTTYFYMCKDAKRLFEKLKDVNIKESITLITNAVKESDKFFKQEETLQEKVTPAKFKAFVKQAFKIKYMLGQIQEVIGRELGSGVRFPDDHVEAIVETYIKQIKEQEEIPEELEKVVQSGPGTLPSWMWK